MPWPIIYSLVIAQLTPKRGPSAPEVPLARTVSTYICIGETTPCVGTPTFTFRTGESIGLKLAASLGVNAPESAAAPAAAGTHAHLATKGETEVVATASQPVITLPPNLNATR